MRVLLFAYLSSIALGGWKDITRSGVVTQGEFFSEENGGYGPWATDRAFVGWKCDGGKCDNKQMRRPSGGDFVIGGDNYQGASNISEEGGRNQMNCGLNRLLARLRCRGGKCDNIDTWCRQLRMVNGKRIKIVGNTWTGWFSEENGGIGQCPNNYYLWGFQCRGGSCDDQRLQCAKLQKWVPNNCAVSAWGAWGNCSKTCGGGSQSRTRQITTQPETGGAACPDLKQTRSCQTQACPVDCTVSAWGQWGQCSKTCGGGEQTRTRSITRQAANNGAACPALSQKRDCNTDACPVDCVVGEFGEWGECSEECGGGEQTRTRSVTRQPANDGAACPALSEKQACNEESCCPDLSVQNKRLKAKEPKTQRQTFRGENAEETACKCLEYCQGQENMLYWQSSLSSNGTKGKCRCFGGELKKVKDKPDTVVGGVDEENHKTVTDNI